MNYYIKERLFAIGAKFDVYNSSGEKAFLVEADKFDFGKNITIYSPDKSEKLMYLKQELRIGAHKYRIHDRSGKEIAIVQKTLMIPEYNISGELGQFKMECDSPLFGRNYDITQNGIKIGAIDKKWTFGRDKYNLEVLEPKYTVLMVGLLIIVDMVRFHSDN